MIPCLSETLDNVGNWDGESASGCITNWTSSIILCGLLIKSHWGDILGVKLVAIEVDNHESDSVSRWCHSLLACFSGWAAVGGLQACSTIG